MSSKTDTFQVENDWRNYVCEFCNKQNFTVDYQITVNNGKLELDWVHCAQTFCIDCGDFCELKKKQKKLKLKIKQDQSKK